MDNMKEKIENELFYMLHEKTLDKITVTELVKRCLVSRQTFYYYFKDVHAVLESIFKRETENLVGAYSDVKNWKSGYVRLLYWSLEHRKYVENIMVSVHREDIEHGISKILYSYAYAEICRYSEGYNIKEHQMDIIAEFYALSLTAYYIRWIEKGMKERPEEEGDKLGILLDGNIVNTIKKFSIINGSIA